MLYSLSLSERGGRILFDPGLRFEHDFSTQATGDSRMRPLWKIYYHHRNLLMVYRKAAGLWFWPALLIVLPKWIMKMRHYKGQKVLFRRLMGRAIRDGLCRRMDLPHDQVVVMSQSGTPPA